MLIRRTNTDNDYRRIVVFHTAPRLRSKNNSRSAKHFFEHSLRLLSKNVFAPTILLFFPESILLKLNRIIAFARSYLSRSSNVYVSPIFALNLISVTPAP